MMKKLLCLLLVLVTMSMPLVGCKNKGQTSSKNPESQSAQSDSQSSVVEPEETEGYVSLLTDKNYENGFWMRGLGAPIYDDPIETFGEKYDPGVKFQYGKQTDVEPEWNLCQWATRYPFHDIENSSPHLPEGKFNYAFTDLGNGKYQYANSSKNFYVDTKTGELSLGLKASECYKYPRTQGQEWPHFLVEKRIYDQPNPPKQCHIASSQSLVVNMDARINSFVDHMGEDADPGLHSAVCMMYLFVSNLDPARKMFTDMLWFGLYVFDNRYVIASQESFPDVGSKGSASEKWIFNISSAEYFDLNNNMHDDNGDVLIGEWRTIRVDVLGKIYEAFEQAQAHGYMKNSQFENLYINGMYFGFELPGTYDIDMSFKNFDITSYIEY